MAIKKLLVANRGEIAIRIMRTAADLGIETVAIYSSDDSNSLHLRKASHARMIDGEGTSAYLNIAAIIGAAKDEGCDAIHPGYGFLSENPDFAENCQFSGIRYVGPPAEILQLFGNKARARDLAHRSEVPIVDGTRAATSLDEAGDFFTSLAPGSRMIVKAISGGGGRGIRIVTSLDELPELYERCRSSPRTRLAVASCMSRSLWREPVTSRYRSWATHTARSPTLANGTAACSAATRSCSNLPRHPGSRMSTAANSSPRPSSSPRPANTATSAPLNSW
jgi:pyruvate carboxylase